MDRPSAAVMAAIFAIVLIVLAAVDLAPGALFIGKHEGDALHLVDILMRMNAGAVPHLDFMTPIGALAFWPMVLFMKLGFGVGHAIVLGQVLVALVLFPALVWAAWSRFHGILGHVFGVAILVLVLGLINGETELSTSVSMYYNRWAWAVAFVVLALAVLDGPRSPVADGVSIGLGLGALVLIKITYVAAFAPVVLIALATRRDWRALAWAAGAGLGLLALVTALMGLGFWRAYLGDLAFVAGSQVRPNPGVALSAVAAAPAWLAGNLLGLAVVVALRRTGHDRAGLVMLLVVLGAVYVTYQNYGNDPLWWGFAGLVALALVGRRPVGAALTLELAGAGLLALAAPSFTNLAYSPFRHMATEAEAYVPLLPGTGRHEDLRVAKLRAERFDIKSAADGPGQPFAGWGDPETRDPPTMLAGEALPDCTLALGTGHWFAVFAADLAEMGIDRGHRVLVTDLLQSIWLYGVTEPIPGGAPWYYGGLPGIEAVTEVLVPLCPMAPKVRAMMLGELEARGVTLEEVGRNPRFILLAVKGQGTGAQPGPAAEPQPENATSSR